MSHPLSDRTPTDLPGEDPAVKSALKAAIARELAEEARSTATAGGTVTPEHLAGPGRLRT
ncbi:MAG TPA: hypothetical protein VGO81_14860 [Solirubrobacteraceae bacterium]|nr:hypothetical protein [Solirubrobacteraceae bacterium]